MSQFSPLRVPEQDPKIQGYNPSGTSLKPLIKGAGWLFLRGRRESFRLKPKSQILNLKAFKHLSQSLNSLKGGSTVDYIGDYSREY